MPSWDKLGRTARIIYSLHPDHTRGSNGSCNGDSLLSLLEELDPQSAARRAKYEGFVVMKLLDSGEGKHPNVSLFTMSAFDPNERAALLSRAAEGVRRIYCTEITSCDILPLLGGDEKLGGTVIDAILKKYQEVSEIEGHSHWAVLSSWLGPLVEGRVIGGRHVQSFEDYIRQAVRDPVVFVKR